MSSVGKFTFDKATVISIAVVIALLGIGYGVGTLNGQKQTQNDIIEQGAAQQSLAGTVQSTNKEGFTVKIGDVGNGTGFGSTTSSSVNGQKAPEGTWTVKYGKNGASVTSSNGAGTGTGSQQLKKGDKVQVTGLAVGDKTLVAQSITKVLPPTPTPKPSATPKQ
jgi:hypothetical protein